MTQSCSERVNNQPCVGLAGPSGRCAVHAAGYQQYAASEPELRCGNCRRVIPPGEWYRRIGVDVRHSKACREHAETAAERMKAASA